ncbi:LPXTG cell wall anchor domain-containing protein [Dorea formicigenerans]|uniref:InlB B-repeat-containing protein n=2 Tax=Dorea formicigenerans TaxID=39486 RepID=UPI001D0AB39D|nr:LPXTG cell wall anchor domain-containing protein [Dorea formicigenerans]MCB8575687.1 LPXTG cell wall anchor domain-containing protein [Dorea formicigenerans]
MKNKVLKQMLAFSLAVSLVGGNSVATFAAEPTNGTESSANTQAATDATEATATFSVDKAKGYFSDFPDQDTSTQGNLQEQDYAITYFPAVVAREGYVWTGWKITDQDGNSTNVGTEYAGAKTWMFTPKAGNVKVVATFKKNVTKKTATLYVAYVDENAHQVGTTQQKITKEGNDGENYTFNITNLNVPDGYELVTATWEKSVAYGDEEFVNVTVKKKEAKKADAVLRVHYVDENGTPLDGSQYIVSLTKNGPVGETATFAATSFKAPEGYELVGGDITDVEVAYGKDKDVNVKVKAIKEEKEARDVIVNFNVAPEEGQFTDPAGAKVVTYTIKEDSADQFLVPTVEAKEGYEFTGWLVNGKEEGFWSADAKTFGITGLAHFPEGSDTGYIVVTAQFKKAEVAKRSVTINVAIDPEKGEFVGRDDKYATITYTDLDEFAEAPILLPEVKANDGYRLAGWTVEGKESIKLDANATTLGFAGLAHFNDGENVGYISVEPVFEEIKEEKVAVVNANVVVDPEKGEFEGYDGATKLENNNLQEADDTLGFLPTVTAKEGYTWTGWEVTNKAGEVVYTLDTNTSSIVFPKGVEDDYTVTATFTENKTTAVVNANVVVDPEKGEFEGYDGATKLENNNLQEADDTLGFLPTVTAKEGYTWTGWEVTNKAGEVVYTLDTNTSSIVFPKGVEDDYTVTATFTKDETPVDPVDPVDPTEPAQPAQPTQPATPSTDNTANNIANKTTDNKKVEKTAAKKAETKNENKKAPKTGDESMPIAYMLTLVGAAVAAIIVLIKRKRTI